MSLTSNAAWSSIPCTLSLKMVVLLKDGFILLMYKRLGQKEIVTKLHQLCPSPYNMLLQRIFPLGQLKLMYNSNMCLPRPNREIFKRTFQFSGVQIWNKLPTAVRSANMISSFQILLLKHIKSNAPQICSCHIYWLFMTVWFCIYCCCCYYEGRKEEQLIVSPSWNKVLDK